MSRLRDKKKLHNFFCGAGIFFVGVVVVVVVVVVRGRKGGGVDQ